MTYQSHVLLEQAVVLVACIAGLPRDAFSFYMYLGTLGTLFEHCGYELGSLKLPLVPLTLGHVTSALSFYAVGFLEGVNAAEHDWRESCLRNPSARACVHGAWRARSCGRRF